MEQLYDLVIEDNLLGHRQVTNRRKANDYHQINSALVYLQHYFLVEFLRKEHLVEISNIQLYGRDFVTYYIR